MDIAMHSNLALSRLLPQLDSVQLRWLKIARAWCSLARGNGGLSLRADASIAQPLNFTVHGKEGELDVALDMSQWPSLAPLQSFSDANLRDAIASLALADMLAMLKDTGWTPDHVQGPLDVPSATQHKSLSIRPRVAMRIGALALDLLPTHASASLAQALELALASQPNVASSRLMRWPLKTCVVLGSRRLLAARLAALRPGDAVFGGMTGQLRLRVVSSRSRACTAAARIDNQEQIMITEPFGEEPHQSPESTFLQPMQSEEEGGYPARAAPAAFESGDSLRALSRLPMDVRYEIDGPDLTVAQAAELAVGDVLALHVPTDGAVVHLRCHGRTIGRGELVNIGGQLGVRITEAGENTWSA